MGATIRPSSSAASTSNSAASELERALEALARVVRNVGYFAVDTPAQKARQVDEVAEQWSLHLLHLRPKPGAEEGAQPAERDYQGVVDFVSTQRQLEQAHAVKTLDDLRQTIWAFVHGMRRAIDADGHSDANVSAQLEQLKAAADKGSIEEVRRIAVSAASSVQEAIAQRQQRQLEHNMAVGRHIAALGRQLEEAERKSALDALTQLSNRRAFDVYVRQVTDLSAFSKESIWLLLCDLDHFKRVNDTFGHVVGDQALQAFGQLLRELFGTPGDFTARYGGEEFAIVLRGTDLEDTLNRGDQLREKLRLVELPSARGLTLTVSIGGTELRPGEQPEAWIARADAALYEAKNSGRDRIWLGD